MRYAQIQNFDVANGNGVGCCLYLQGCSLRCKNCFNPTTWDFNGGKLFDKCDKENLFNILSKKEIQRLTIIGGEALDQAKELKILLKEIRKKFPNKQIWIYSGRTLEENTQDKDKSECLSLCDFLVDGKYVDELKDLTLEFRGSSNQRIWDLRGDMPIDVTEEKGWRK